MTWIPNKKSDGSPDTAVLTLGGTSSRVAMPEGRVVVMTYEGTGGFYRMGGSDVVALVDVDHRLPSSGGSMKISRQSGDSSYIAAIGNGKIYLSGGSEG